MSGKFNQTVEKRIGGLKFIILKSDEDLLNKKGVSWYVSNKGGYNIIGKYNDKSKKYETLRSLIGLKHKIKSDNGKYYLKDYSTKPLDLTPSNITDDNTDMLLQRAEKMKETKSNQRKKYYRKNSKKPVSTEVLDVKEVYDIICPNCQKEIKDYVAQKYLGL